MSAPSSVRCRQRTVAVGAGLVIALALSACAQDLDDPGEEDVAAPDADEEVVLQFTWWGSDKRHTYTQELIELYQSQNPGVRIVGTFTGFSDYWDRLNTNIAGGNMPDVMQHETRYIREYVDRGLLADLNELTDIIDVDHLDPAVAETGVLGGSLYALPIGVNAFAVAIDPQVFESVGVDVPDDTSWTWQDWVDVAAEVSAASGGQYLGVQPKPQHDAMLDVFARQRGEALFTEDGQIGISEATLEDFFSIVLAFHETGGAAPASQALEIDAADLDGSILATNSGASAPFWSNQLPALEQASGREMTLLRFPGEFTEQQSGMFLKPAQFWAISEQSEHQEEAARFVDFLLNDEQAIDIMLSERGLPANLERRQAILDDLPPADQRTAAFLDEIGPDLLAPPFLPPPGGGQVEDVVKRLYEELLFERITVQEAAGLYVERLEQVIG